MNKIETFRKIDSILTRRNPALSAELKAFGNNSKLDGSLRRAIVHELLAELTDCGLGPTDEPTAYGLEIEALIDLVQGNKEML